MKVAEISVAQRVVWNRTRDARSLSLCSCRTARGNDDETPRKKGWQESYARFAAVHGCMRRRHRDYPNPRGASLERRPDRSAARLALGWREFAIDVGDSVGLCQL